MFSYLTEAEIIILATLDLSSANAFNLFMTRILSFTSLSWSKLKAFADSKINVTKKLKFLLERIENIMWEMEKMLVTSIFSFSHNVFKRLVIQSHESLRLCGKELIHTEGYYDDTVATQS